MLTSVPRTFARCAGTHHQRVCALTRVVSASARTETLQRQEQLPLEMQRFKPTGKSSVGVLDVSAEARELGTEKVSLMWSSSNGLHNCQGYQLQWDHSGAFLDTGHKRTPLLSVQADLVFSANILASPLALRFWYASHERFTCPQSFFG